MILLDGQKVAQQRYQTLFEKVTYFKEQTQQTPSLVAVHVGKNPASLTYLKRKKEAAEKLGMHFQEAAFPEDTTLEALQNALFELNTNPRVHGIILQLPIPSHLNQALLLYCIYPQKDVDGLHPLNQGNLISGTQTGYIPCTPLACLKLVNAFGFHVQGKRCVVIGRSVLVGKPLGLLLLNHHATVTFCHSQTPHLAQVTREADVLFVAIGKPETIEAKHVKPGACVVDVGINRLPEGQLKGDVCFESVAEVAGALSPVPGGVGPLTVLCLLENTLTAAYRSCNLSYPS